MNKIQKYLLSCLFGFVALFGGSAMAWAQNVTLGAASDFSVLAGTSITCTDSLVATGDVGVVPPGAFTNTRCTFTGATPPETDAAAVQAHADFLSAYAALLGEAASCTVVPGDLDGEVLGPGVYCIDAVAKAGTLTLTGGPDDSWIFIGEGALTGTNFTVTMADGAQSCNVFWAPSAAVTMTDSAFKGNILAGDATLGSITLTGGSLAGRALANIAVTMTGASVIGCDALSDSLVCKPGKDNGQDRARCNQGVGNGPEGCDPGNSNQGNPFLSNDEEGGVPGEPGRKGGNR